MERTQFASLTRALKTVLKSKGLTYAELAQLIDMSESGLKKLLTAEDGSVGRLDTMCRALGIKLLDLIQIAEAESPVSEFRLPLKVQEFFIANFDCFRVFWMLMYDELPPEKIQSELKMSEKEFWKHVRQLDRFDLVKVGESNRLTLPQRDHLVWANEGPLIDLLLRTWGRGLMEQVAANRNAEDHYLSLRMFRLTQASRSDLLQAVKDLKREFGHRSLRERLVTSDAKLFSVRMMTVMAAGSFASER